MIVSWIDGVVTGLTKSLFGWRPSYEDMTPNHTSIGVMTPKWGCKQMVDIYAHVCLLKISDYQEVIKPWLSLKSNLSMSVVFLEHVS